MDTSLLQGAPEFHCHGYLTPELDLKAACVGFRNDLWYHLNFLARRTSDGHAVALYTFAVNLLKMDAHGRWNNWYKV
jgi:hypothetical protein